MDSSSRAARLDLFALVRQRTGEDWKDAALVLSTARPSASGQIPELSPWYLREHVARRDDVYELSPFSVNARGRGYASADMAPSPPPRFRYAYDLEVRNGRSHEINLSFVDRVPVSRDERITVRLVQSPRDAEGPDEEGMLRWKSQLRGGDSATYSLIYSVDFPRDLRVTGID